MRRKASWQTVGIEGTAASRETNQSLVAFVASRLEAAPKGLDKLDYNFPARFYLDRGCCRSCNLSTSTGTNMCGTVSTDNVMKLTAKTLAVIETPSFRT